MDFEIIEFNCLLRTYSKNLRLSYQYINQCDEYDKHYDYKKLKSDYDKLKYDYDKLKNDAQVYEKNIMDTNYKKIKNMNFMNYLFYAAEIP
jgi:hypothetical protein